MERTEEIVSSVVVKTTWASFARCPQEGMSSALPDPGVVRAEFLSSLLAVEQKLYKV
jgi:hypothetical protein